MTAVQVPGFQAPVADPVQFARRMDAAFAADDAEAVRQLSAELQSNPELANSKYPGLDMTFGEFLKVATEPARSIADRKMDQMRVPGKGPGANQFQPGYDYGGNPVESLGDAGHANNLSGPIAHSHEDIASTTTPGPSEGGAPPQQQATPAPPREAPPAPAMPESIGAPVGGVMPPEFNPRQLFDLVNKTYSDRFDAAFEAGAGGIRDEDRKTREMAARFASALGLPPEQAAAVYSKIVEPQLQRETSERNAQAISQQRSMGMGFGQELGLRKFGQQQFDKFFNANDIKKDWDSIKTLQNSFGTLAKSHEAGGWGVADHVAIKSIIAALENGRISEKDYDLMERGLGTVWYDLKGWLEQRLGGGISGEEFERRGVEALQGLSPTKRRGFLESLRIIYDQRLGRFNESYQRARGMVNTAGSPEERDQFIRNIQSTFDRAFWENDPEINRELSKSSGSPQGGSSESTRSSAKGRAVDLLNKSGH